MLRLPDPEDLEPDEAKPDERRKQVTDRARPAESDNATPERGSRTESVRGKSARSARRVDHVPAESDAANLASVSRLHRDASNPLFRDGAPEDAARPRARRPDSESRPMPHTPAPASDEEHEPAAAGSRTHALGDAEATCDFGCPLCAAMATMRELQPETMEHFSAASRELMAAVRAFAGSIERPIPNVAKRVQRFRPD